MNNFGPALVKLTLLAGGAVIGVLVARWYEEIRSTRVETQFQRDKTRYAEGLTPVEQQRGYQGYQGRQAS